MLLPAHVSCCAAEYARRRGQCGDRPGAGRSPAIWLGLAPDTVKSGDWCTASVYCDSDGDPGEERESEGRKDGQKILLICILLCTQYKNSSAHDKCFRDFAGTQLTNKQLGMPIHIEPHSTIKNEKMRQTERVNDDSCRLEVDKIWSAHCIKV